MNCWFCDALWVSTNVVYVSVNRHIKTVEHDLTHYTHTTCNINIYIYIYIYIYVASNIYLIFLHLLMSIFWFLPLQQLGYPLWFVLINLIICDASQKKQFDQTLHPRSLPPPLQNYMFLNCFTWQCKPM
jgi:hypothetical protein